VHILPRTTTLSPYQTQQFTTIVTNSTNPAVNWSVNQNLGMVTSTGIYTAPGDVPTQQTATVTATSHADSTKSASAIVTLLPGVTGGAVGHTVSLIADALCRHPHVAPTVTAGPDLFGRLTCNGAQCSASTTATGVVSSYYLTPGLPLSYAWNVISGPAPVQFGSQTSPSTTVAVTVAGLYTLQLTVSDGLAASTAVTHFFVDPANSNTNGNLSISPTVMGPIAINTPVSMTARALNFAFGAATNATIKMTVTGA